MSYITDYFGMRKCYNHKTRFKCHLIRFYSILLLELLLQFANMNRILCIHKDISFYSFLAYFKDIFITYEGQNTCEKSKNTNIRTNKIYKWRDCYLCYNNYFQIHSQQNLLSFKMWQAIPDFVQSTFNR